jgi:predicted transcriptional regulator
MALATSKNLHVPLPPKVYRALRDAADRAGRPATQVAREAIVQWLEAERRREAEDDLRAYVAEMPVRNTTRSRRPPLRFGQVLDRGGFELCDEATFIGLC